MLARFTASAPEFYIFREFRYLQSRVLLHLQDEIRALETQLWRIDEKDKMNNPQSLSCRELDDTRNGTRKIIMDQVQNKLVQYGKKYVNKPGLLIDLCAGELLCMSNKLAALDRPTKFERTNLHRFFRSRQPLVLHEDYIGNASDLVSLKADRDDAWLDRQILGLLIRANNRFLSVSLIQRTLSAILSHLSRFS